VDFVDFLVEACREERLTLLQATPANLDSVLAGLNAGDAAFRAFFDRASDEEPAFLPLAEWAVQNGVCCINPHDRASVAWDKAEMHVALSAELHIPPTLILPPYRDRPELPPLDLAPLGASFTIKPAYGGGGLGVVTCISPEKIPEARRLYPDRKYILQSHIVPVRLDGRPAWFRVLYVAGRYYPCWWDVKTHAYTPVTCAAEEHYGLRPLREIAQTVARISGLHLFSTEVALTPDGRFLVIDYVNNPVDLRSQSKTPDGVPNLIVRFIARDMARFVASALARGEAAATTAPCPGEKGHEGI